MSVSRAFGSEPSAEILYYIDAKKIKNKKQKNKKTEQILQNMLQ